MSVENRPKANSKRTLEVVPNLGEMVKPSELIEVKGAAKLSLADRRLYNVLLHNAFGPDLGTENRRFEIPLSELRDTHDSNDRLVQSIEALMTTVVTMRRGDGSTDRVQLLGWNNLSDSKRKHGFLKYSIPPELAILLRDSMVFAKLEMEVLRAFTSKYALALYEAVARRVRLQHISSEKFALDDFRELLGVEHDKLTTFGNLNQYAIKPALLEVNALSDFLVSVEPVKQGRRVVGVAIGWSVKDLEGRKAAYAELQRSRVGRRPRLAGAVETIDDEALLA
ncbi:replication initiation protein [Paracoccus sp. WLY502]|uniref:replication initiation protein n=1 Tax=Paracoccus yibinensis TaxID=3068891 RepID=UPI0027967DC5|nr:replication initiation protein [Paracoccus sp. WLY502]MDQ1902381.1 replication initiation protein [Paracoccus sp. WLY502]